MHASLCAIASGAAIGSRIDESALLIGAPACHALSLISLARWWIGEQGKIMLLRRQLEQALTLLRSMALMV